MSKAVHLGKKVISRSFLCLLSHSPKSISSRFSFDVISPPSSVYPRVLIGLALAQLTLAGYVYVRSGITQATCMLPLPVIIYWYGYRSFKR